MTLTRTKFYIVHLIAGRTMRTIVFTVCPLDNRRRPWLLIYVILAVILPIHVPVEAQKNEHGNTYLRRSSVSPGFSENTEQSKVSIVDDENKDSKVSESADSPVERLSK